MPFTRYLSDDDIDTVYNAAIKLGLAAARDVLLGSIPDNFGSNLKIIGAPGPQLRNDLQEMNVIESLEDPDRTIPLQRWLSTAYQLHRIRTEAKVLKSALDKIGVVVRGGTNTAGSVIATQSPTPRKGWGASLSGGEMDELCDALLQAFPDRPSLAQMVLFGLNLRLDDVAANSNLKHTVFDLVVHANAHGLIFQLFDAARIKVPGNPALLALVPKRGA